MATNLRIGLAGVLLAALFTACGCQLYNTGREVRSEEQMLPVTFENARAEEFFMKAVQSTYGQEQNVKRIGFPRFSLYSHSETVAWNANCNDHIRDMDKDGNRIVTEQEAQSHYESLMAAKEGTGGSHRE
jgi:hypothetical protein